MDIKSWAEEDRPREKLLLKGKSSLSDAELIGILINSGTSNLSAVDVGKIVLREAGNDLNKLAKMSVQDLMKFKGIGEAKAISIVSALELGRRRKESDSAEVSQIRTSQDVYDVMKPDLMDLQSEEFWVLLLNRANRVISKRKISLGGVSGTIADPKIIFKYALEYSASSIILIHNHPSGNLNPSEADKQLTIKMREAGKVLDISVLDHLIFTDQSFFSFADENLL